jgi:hypothetical protein
MKDEVLINGSTGREKAGLGVEQHGGESKGGVLLVVDYWKVFRNPPSGEVPSSSVSALVAVDEKGFPSF